MNNTLVYVDAYSKTEGILFALPGRMRRFIEFDRLYVAESKSSARGTLWFGRGMKRILRVSLARHDGCWLVEISGGDPSAVLRATSVCRDHFDRWFGTSAQDAKTYEAQIEDRAVERPS
ncbi:MAG: hypothetical protein NTW87_06050 [Planctomycetota bacterium]|nr:hypothetical protein [Planctomycetota bacterium]